MPSHSTTSVMGPLATPMTHPTPPKTDRRLAPRPRRLKPQPWSMNFMSYGFHGQQGDPT